MNYTFWDFIRSLFVSDFKDDFVIKAESWMSNYYGGRQVTLTSAGRSALYYILRSLPQSKVYIPAYTCEVVSEAVSLAGKEMHYVELSSEGFTVDCFPNLDNDSIVIATHQFGYPCAIKAIASACKLANAILIEDCASAIGTRVDGQLVGTFGDYAFVSFNHSKQLTIPRGGGAVITKTVEQMNRIKLQMKIKYNRAWSLKNRRFALICLLINNSLFYRLFYLKMIEPHEDCSNSTLAAIAPTMDFLYETQMNNWQAFLLYMQLKRMSKYIERRKVIFEFYDDKIKSGCFQKPYKVVGADYSRYVVKVRGRDKYLIYKYCVENGVDLDFSHTHLTCPKSFTIEHQLASCVVNLPFYYKLSLQEANKVVHVLNQIT